MVDANTKCAEARRYIQKARSLLADMDEIPAATHLDDALASLFDRSTGGCSVEERARRIGSPDAVIVRAIGGAMTIFGAILARSGLVPLDELGRLFDVYATVSAADDPLVGTIVRNWSEMLDDAAQGLSIPPAD